jgi:hypothetical protein
MPVRHLACDFRRRLIVDAFVGDIPRRRLRGALDNNALDALVDWVTSIVLIHFLAPHAGQLGLRGQGTHGGGGAALLGHVLGTGGLGFGNQALNRHLRVGDSFRRGLLMDGKLLFLQFSNTPYQARHFLDAMRGLFGWAVKAGLIKTDPTAGVDNPLRPHSEGFAPWSEDDIAAYERRWPIGTRRRVWLDVLIYTGLRRGDAVRLGRQHVRDGVATIKTEKTGTEVTLPILPILIRTLEAGPCGDLTFIAGANGRPLTKESFGNLFSKACRDAGLHNRSAHGLRKAAATRAASAGATVAELEAIFGWQGGRWLRFTLALQIGADWHKARCTSSQERLTNKRYPHLSGKLPAPRKIPSKNKLIIFAWWAREDSNLQPSGYEPFSVCLSEQKYR